jgi:hypothetical protein
MNEEILKEFCNFLDTGPEGEPREWKEVEKFYLEQLNAKDLEHKKVLEKLLKEIEVIIQEDRFSGTPYSLNKVKTLIQEKI